MSMSIKNFIRSAKSLPPEISIVLRADHGVGKSQSVYELARQLDLPCLERRLSQMTEGDMIGLPILDGKTTRFCPPDWIFEAVEKPVVLFLDEINRACQEVQQAAFQLVGMREMNGVKLHPDTRVVSAINLGGDYQVNEMDPAFQDRFWVVDLKPTSAEWLAWAKTRLDPLLVDFIRKNPKHLENTKQIDPDLVTPSRRSWEKVDKSLKHADLYGEGKANSQHAYQIVMGFCGPSAAGTFRKFAANFKREISAEEILNSWSEKAKGRIVKVTGKGKNQKVTPLIDNPTFLILVDRVVDHCEKNEWTDKQVSNAAEFMKVLPKEHVVQYWTKIQKANFANAKSLHTKHTKDFLLLVVNAASAQGE